MKRCPGREGVWTLLGGIFDLPKLESEIRELEGLTAQPDFWNDSQAANKTVQKLARLKNTAEPFMVLDKLERDVSELYEMLREMPDAETEQEADKMALDVRA